MRSSSCLPSVRVMRSSSSLLVALALALVVMILSSQDASALIPLIDGGKDMPKLYDGWFNDQIAKQASTALGKAVAAGKKRIEVNFPPVPNVEEVKFGTPLNQRFGKSLIAKDLNIPGGYQPGSRVSRELLAYSNLYWAKRLASAARGGPLSNRPVCVLTSDNVDFRDVRSFGDVSRTGDDFSSTNVRAAARKNEVFFFANPGGEERWDSLVSSHGGGGNIHVMLNPTFSTSYNLGNRRGFEEAYYLKRVSKGWIFRMYPGPWQLYLERPNGSVALLKSYPRKPQLNECSALLRDTSFEQYGIFNDRWSQGFGGRL